MQKKVFITHGWDGHPGEGWFPWLSRELREKGLLVYVPVMPEPANLRIEAWISHLSSIAGDPDAETFFVGHSIGCQTILRYLERLPVGKKVGGVVFVAPWFTPMNLKTAREREIARPWLETGIDCEKVKRHGKKFFAVFSDNDDVVPLDNKELFEKKLHAQTIVEHKRGHFSGSDGVNKLPVVLEKLSRMMS